MKILLAIDGSSASRAAEQTVMSYPFGDQVQLRIATVCPSADMHPLLDVPAAVQGLVDQCRARSTELLAEAATRCRAWCAEVDTVLLDGHPAREILHVADEWQANLIVLGARGLGAVSRFLLGSVSDGVAKRAHCSVLVVRDKGPQPTGKRIVIGYDGSAQSEAIIQRLIAWPRDEQRSILLVGVIEQIHVYGVDLELSTDPIYPRLHEKLELQLKAATHKLSSSTSNVSSIVHYAADAADEIVNAAATFHADVIALGSRSRNTWERLFLGSTAVRVLHHAPCSVWIERPQAT